MKFDPARTIDLAKGALLEPESTWEKYLPEAGDWQHTAIVLTAPLIVAAAIVAYVLGLLLSGMSAFGFRPTLISTILGIIGGGIGAAIVAFIFSACAKMFGGKDNFALGLAATTLAFVPGYLGRALSSLPWIGWLLGIGLTIYGLVLLWRIIPLYLEVPNEKRAPHYAVSLIASFIAMLVLGAILGRAMGGGTDPRFGDMGRRGATTQSETSSSAGGLFGGIARQGELIGMAEEDRYDPPRDGEVSTAQVREFIRVMQRTAEAVAERAQRLQDLSERSEADEPMSMSDLGTILSGATAMTGLNTAEIEVVKSAGGNWAEHQWVKESLRTAWLQKDVNDTVEHNYALYQEYEDELAPFIAQ
jgi:hypothetical protein